MARRSADTSPRRSHASVFLALLVALLIPLPADAIEEGLRELRLPPLAVEEDIKPDTASELPPPTYPVQRVEQLAFHGAMHELVNVTTGGLVFRMPDMRLPGRMPIDFGRVYDSKISESLPPPPPFGQCEARWTEDLGKNWILGYTGYIIPVDPPLLEMATPEGDVIRWIPQGDGTYLPTNPLPSKHLILEEDGPMVLVETQTDGTRWSYTFGVADGSTHALTKIEDRSGNYIEMVYATGRLVEIRNSDGATLTLHRDNNDPNLFPVERVTSVSDGTGRVVGFDYNTDGLLTSVTDVRGHVWTLPTRPTTSSSLPRTRSATPTSRRATTERTASRASMAGAAPGVSSTTGSTPG